MSDKPQIEILPVPDHLMELLRLVDKARRDIDAVVGFAFTPVVEHIDPNEAYWWPPEARNLEEAGACPVVTMTPAELRRRFPDPKG